MWVDAYSVAFSYDSSKVVVGFFKAQTVGSTAWSNAFGVFQASDGTLLWAADTIETQPGGVPAKRLLVRSDNIAYYSYKVPSSYNSGILAFDITQTPTTTVNLLFSNQYSGAGGGNIEVYASLLGTYEYILPETFQSSPQINGVYGLDYTTGN